MGLPGHLKGWPAVQVTHKRSVSANVPYVTVGQGLTHMVLF